MTKPELSELARNMEIVVEAILDRIKEQEALEAQGAENGIHD